MTQLLLAIDPGHGAFGICYYLKPDTTDPHDASFIAGKEKPGTLGCPESVGYLLPIMIVPMLNYATPLIAIEEMFTRSPKMMRSMGSQHRDIGYIIRAVEPYKPQVELVSSTDWKKHLESLGIFPPKSGLIKPEKFKPILDERFGMDLKADCWSAWGVHKFIFDNREHETNETHQRMVEGYQP